MDNSMESLWSGLGMAAVIFAFLAGCALLIRADKEKEDKE